MNRSSRWMWAAAALLVGLLAGVNLTGWLPRTPVLASATHGENSFAVCTADLDEDVEGVFFLDFLTGDLKAGVLSMQSGKFMTAYERNVTGDFARGVKNPRFLMVSGRANLRRGAGPQPMPGRAVIYVAEINSGIVAAYGLPWSASRASATTPLKSEIVLLDRTKFRTRAIRDSVEEEE